MTGSLNLRCIAVLKVWFLMRCASTFFVLGVHHGRGSKHKNYGEKKKPAELSAKGVALTEKGRFEKGASQAPSCRALENDEFTMPQVKLPSWHC
jgi:hypothetical protein